jgi:hypothetical protein
VITSWILIAIYINFRPDSEPEYKRFHPDYTTYEECKFWKEYLEKNVKAGKVWVQCLKRKKSEL